MWQACKLTPTRTQISIQCERTSFLASFASSAGKKDMFQVITYQETIDYQLECMLLPLQFKLYMLEMVKQRINSEV